MDYENLFNTLNIPVLPLSENYTPESYAQALMAAYEPKDISDIAYSNTTTLTRSSESNSI